MIFLIVALIILASTAVTMWVVRRTARDSFEAGYELGYDTGHEDGIRSVSTSCPAPPPNERR